MKQSEIVYTKALHKLFRAARRFRGQLEQFREEDIGSEVWDAINAGSMITNAMSAAEIGNSMLLEELWKLGAVRREKLTKQDSALYGVLTTDGWKVAFENIIVTGVVDSRVKSILVAYRPYSAMDETTVRTKAEVAITRTMSDDPDDVVYASELKKNLESEGLYGIALQDMREAEYDWLLARVIAMGRLKIHLRREAGLAGRPPKPKKNKKVDQQ